jgi:hypothetical protein
MQSESDVLLSIFTPIEHQYYRQQHSCGSLQLTVDTMLEGSWNRQRQASISHVAFCFMERLALNEEL